MAIIGRGGLKDHLEEVASEGFWLGRIAFGGEIGDGDGDGYWDGAGYLAGLEFVLLAWSLSCWLGVSRDVSDGDGREIASR